MPDPSRESVKALFLQAADLDPERRGAFLDHACAGDAAVRAAVEELLHFDAEAQNAPEFLRSPVAAVRSALPPATAVPASIGRYRVVRRLGQGGMGTVYEADQDDPRRTVALKVMLPGADSDDLRKRFVQEARILGRLDHIGIARVHDAGATEFGQLYFAMEFIRGLPLHEYVRHYALDVSARLELVSNVCDAVQHAHEKGVIHRDLKPANVMVDEAGRPKVLDFGVAHATVGGTLGVSAAHTRTGQLIGTLGYMSPEQVAGDPRAIDARSDVYALGVILYELLADRLPYRLDNLPIPEVVRVIREVEPARLGSVNRRFRGAIETVVAKALEKEKTRRYASAGELGDDLRRHLADEPVRARPPSALYHLRQFTRRNTALVGAVLGIGAALAAGTVVSVLYALRADHNAREAGASARRAAESEQRAKDEKSEALVQTYRACLAAAAAALAEHDVVAAARHLAAAPEELRGWEWRHLHSRLDDSSSAIPLPEGRGFLLTGPGQLRVATWIPAGLRFTDPRTDEHGAVLIGPGHERIVAAAQTRRGLRFVTRVGPPAFEQLNEAGQVLCRVDTRPDVLAPVVSPDGTRLACSLADGEWKRLGVFDAASGRQTAVCEGHLDGLWAYAFSPDGTRLASAGEDRTARVWDPATGVLLATCRGHTSKVLGAAFRSDGTRLVTTSSDGTVRQWDAATGREVEPAYDRHSGEVTVAAFSPDGQWVASGGTDRTVRVWRATGRQDVAVLHGHLGAVTDLAFGVDGRRLGSVSSHGPVSVGDGTARFWNVDPQATLPELRGHARFVYPVAFSPDGRWLASGSWDATVRLWDAATGEPVATLHHPGVVWDLAFGPDGRWLVTGTNRDDRLRIWDVGTARVRKEIQCPAGTFRSVTVSPDGRRVAATAFDPIRNRHDIHVCDVTSGERLFSAEGRALAYSPDGRWLATLAADEKVVVLLDARTHETAARFQGHEEFVHKVAFSPDGRHLASCSRDRTVRLWEIDGAACRVLRGQTDEVFAVAFHPDGRRLATAGKDRAVWLWDVERGEEVARLPGHTSYVWSLAFSPDGKTLVSGSGDTSVRLWDTEPVRVRYQARRAAESLRPEAAALVEKLFGEKKDAAEVVATVREDRSLSESQRHAALRAVLRQLATPGK